MMMCAVDASAARELSGFKGKLADKWAAKKAWKVDLKDKLADKKANLKDKLADWKDKKSTYKYKPFKKYYGK